jgi:hypothetical protein
MRAVQLAAMLATTLAAGLRPGEAPLRPGQAGPRPAAPSVPPVAVKRTDFDVFLGDSDRQAGRMTLVATEVPGRVVLDLEFVGPHRDSEAGFKGRAVYDRAADRPRPLHAEASTRVGRNRLMEGKVEFEPKSGGLVARTAVTGYADRKGTLYREPKVQTGETPVPEGVLLTYAALVYFAPTLQRQTGSLDGVVYAALPKDLEFPELIGFTADCRLVRVNTDELGACRIELRQMFPGGNYKLKAFARYTHAGEVLETGFAQFTMRPAAPGRSPAAREAK